MAFNQQQSVSKNQFAARIVSNKTGAMVGWFHPVDDFARKVCGANSVVDITFAQANEFLPQILNNERFSCIITDLTAERELIQIEDL